MTSSERHALAELARLRRILANPSLTAFEIETARAALNRLEAASRPIPCVHCTLDPATHNGAQCPVVARFQRRAGKGSIPTPVQSQDLRAKMAAEDEAQARGERKRATKAGQGTLF